MPLPQLSVAHLTALELAPPELVRAASEAGFSSVGVRVHPSTSAETTYPMLPPSAMLDQTLKAMKDTGVRVCDIEVLGLTADIGPETWFPVLEAGAALGAKVLNVVGTDPEVSRFTDKLGRLVDDASQFNIRPSLEPISYQYVSSLDQAHRIAEETGSGIILDALHFMRSGGSITELETFPKHLVSVVQLCDGSLSEPAFETLDVELPLGQSVSNSARQFEARAQRGIPGSGQFPLKEMIECFPDAPLSVEVPDVFSVSKNGIDHHLATCVDTTLKMINTGDTLQK